ncbi:MAG: 16S rRNA (guanine(966)-N(2))-methyltransferase RsmD [Halioglobus sp.]
MARSKSPGRHTGNTQSQLRIIGGQWRSRKLGFTPAEGLRPTSDRIRETLFNWLAPSIVDARCADLFAGSGALGLEALSRGASHCDFVDSAASATAQINANLSSLNAQERGQCHSCEASTYLQKLNHKLDIVFIDPPFGHNLVQPTIEQLLSSQALAPQALIYIETGKDEPLSAVPAHWLRHREKTSGGVCYRLYCSDIK